MTESGYYPPGAEFDSRAPWNQPDEEPEAHEGYLVVTTSIPVTYYGDSLPSANEIINDNPDIREALSHFNAEWTIDELEFIEG